MSTDPTFTLTVIDMAVVLGLFVGAIALTLLVAELVLALFPRVERLLSRLIGFDRPREYVVRIEGPDDPEDLGEFVDLARLHLTDEFRLRGMR